MWKAAKQMLGSKKALAAIVSVVGWAVGRFGLKINIDDIVLMLTPIWLYIFGQGMADVGKSKAQIDAPLEPAAPEAAKPPAPGA